MVNCGKCEVRSTDRSSLFEEGGERLRRGHFVDEVEVHIEQVETLVDVRDDVLLPDLVEERLTAHSAPPLAAEHRRGWYFSERGTQ